MSIFSSISGLAVWPAIRELPERWQKSYWLIAVIPGLLMASAETVQFYLYPVFQAPNVSNTIQTLITFTAFYGPVALIPRLAWFANRYARVNALGEWHTLVLQGAILMAASSLHLIIVTLALAFMHSPAGWYPHFPRFVGEIWLTEFPRWALVYSLVAFVLYRLQTPAGSKTAADIELRENGCIHFVQWNTVRWVEATGNYVCLHTHERTITARGSLVGFERRDRQSEFIKVHRGAVVRKALIQSIEIVGTATYRLVLMDGTKIPVSRRRVASIRKILSRR